ncbi:MAG: redox-regulated ATPase YchF [Thermoprotei archaeon]|nr:MAG: redox-regulated ATPase YchF [Thermoprotei archaeon]
MPIQYVPVQVGVVGKPNVGKTTFFAAATLIDAKIAPYPFTTIEPNRGIGYVRIECVCREFGVRDNPRNSICIDGWRFIPIELIDVAGLVPGAWEGRGLGNRFLDELRRAPVLIHVVDAAGATDEEGRPTKPGTRDPCEDIRFLEKEVDMWIFQNLKREWDRVVRLVEMAGKDILDVLYERFSGYGVSRGVIECVLNELDLARKKPSRWSDNDLLNFVHEVRVRAKPIVIAANKADIPEAEDNIKRMVREFPHLKIVPTSAVAELALRKAAKSGLIKYLPGDPDFEVIDEKRLTSQQAKALEYIRERILKKWGSTGVQQVINEAIFGALGMVAVFPVEDENKLCDKDGNVLPDVLLVPKGTTARELAYRIHTELGENFICAIDVRTKQRLGADTPLENRAVVKIVARR